MFTLIKNANLYAPAYLGKTDILLCGERLRIFQRQLN